MFTGVFKDRTRAQADAPQLADQLLGELLQARILRQYRFARQCEIGPFVVDYVCCEHSLVVELRDKNHLEARSAFLAGMGYTVIYVTARELKSEPQRLLARIQAALQ
jgi:very-short-patch-repair endonuclease